ncbi:MAG: hemolysin family protein [bacterium]
MLITNFLIFLVLILVSAVFSGTETALMTIGPAKVEALIEQNKKGAKALKRIKKNTHRLIITILIGNNLVNIAAASLATVFFTDLFGSKGVGIATGIMTFLILVFGEITPKTYAANNAVSLSLMLAKPMEVLIITILPLVMLFEYIAKGMSWLLRSKKEDKLSEEEIKSVVTLGHKEGVLTEDEAEMIENVLDFEDKTVKEVMTPVSNVKMVDGAKQLSEVVDYVAKTPHSEYPVYLNNKNNIIGALDVDDVLEYVKDDKEDVLVKDITRGVLQVTEKKEIDDLLQEHEHEDMPLVIVTDDNEKVIGLVTTEDILEEIVGEIFDKSDREDVLVEKIDAKTARVSAMIPLEEVNKKLKLNLKGRKFFTLAGFILHRLKRMPKEGEIIKLKNAIIEVDEVTGNAIESVKIIKK